MAKKIQQVNAACTNNQPMNFFNNFYSSVFYLWDEFFVSNNSRVMALTWLSVLEMFLLSLLRELIKKYLHFDIAFGIRFRNSYSYLIGGTFFIINLIIYNKTREKTVLDNFYKKSRFERKLWVLGSLLSLVLLLIVLYQVVKVNRQYIHNY